MIPQLTPGLSFLLDTGFVAVEFLIFKLQQGASMIRFVGLSVCLSVCMSKNSKSKNGLYYEKKVEKSERMKSNDNNENEKKRRKLIENREDDKKKNDEKEMEDEKEKREENEKNDENRGENEKIKDIPKIEDFPHEVRKSPKIGLFEKMGKNSGNMDLEPPPSPGSWDK